MWRGYKQLWAVLPIVCGLLLCLSACVTQTQTDGVLPPSLQPQEKQPYISGIRQIIDTDLDTPSNAMSSDMSNKSMPEQLISPVEFNHSDYYLMVFCKTDQYTGGQDPIYTGALLGEGIADIQEGRILFDALNAPYQKETPIGYAFDPGKNTQMPPFSPAALQRVHRYLFTRQIIYLSKDGTHILCRSFPNPSDSYSEYDWDILYETFSGRDLVASHLITRDRSRGNWYWEQKYEAISGDEEAALLAEYFDWTLLPRAVPYPPFAQEYEYDALLSPDSQYYAFRAPDSYERDEYGYLNEHKKWIETPIPPYGHPRFGYYIRNLETGETTFYETVSGIYRIGGWTNKDVVDALITENERKGPIDERIALPS